MNKEDHERARLVRLWKMLDEYDEPRDINTIDRLCSSANADDRLFGLLMLRESTLDDQLYAIAHRMIPDEDNCCRWQALIAVSMWIDDDPERVWQVVCEFGDTEDDDMRAAVGCCVLEELLHARPDVYLPKVREQVERSTPFFFKTVEYCWADQPSVDEYIARKREELD